MGGSSARSKGKRGELELCKILSQALSIPVRRVPLSGAMEGHKGDLEVPGLHVEVKRAETWHLAEWIRQMEDQSGDKMGALMFRKSRSPWYCLMTLNEWLELWKRYADG
jgi:hypothetical protein